MTKNRIALLVLAGMAGLAGLLALIGFSPLNTALIVLGPAVIVGVMLLLVRLGLHLDENDARIRAGELAVRDAERSRTR